MTSQSVHPLHRRFQALVPRSAGSWLVLVIVLALGSRLFADQVRAVALSVSVRLQKDPNSAVLATVEAGTILTADGRDGNWYRVRLPAEGQGLERVGYVSASDVEPIGPVGAVPSGSPTQIVTSGKSTIAIQVFTVSEGIELPYDLKQLQAQLVADLKVQMGKEFNIVAAEGSGQASSYVLDGTITAWNPGNAAKRLIVGLGSGRESTDIRFRISNASGVRVLDRVDTVRTNFYSQGAGSTGTLAHPIALKIADRVRAASLK